ncbi:hypothetical protein [Leisingera sp. ANG59]|uniref:hypothetical protein n=1 Tax=Leisingera sp. ANG59 TaxID=2675221 RepID=UPI00157373E2|nr:hypothetical protein [Leisingera sp. ANG59]NSY36842.1 hypothetical protein [Leisingera sp. ANG59]
MSEENKPQTVADFLEVAERAQFQKETGFSVQLVTRAKRVGLFPAHWFWTVREYCDRRGIEVPEHLFKGHPDASGKDAA